MKTGTIIRQRALQALDRHGLWPTIEVAVKADRHAWQTGRMNPSELISRRSKQGKHSAAIAGCMVNTCHLFEHMHRASLPNLASEKSWNTVKQLR
jgi:hypothetical protein